MATISAKLLGYAPGMVTGLCTWGFLHHRRNSWEVVRSQHDTKIQELVDKWTNSLEIPPVIISLDAEDPLRAVLCPHRKGIQTICTTSQQVGSCLTDRKNVYEHYEAYKNDVESYKTGKKHILGLLVFAVGVAALSILFPPAGMITREHVVHSTFSSLAGVAIALMLYKDNTSPNLAPGDRLINDVQPQK